jgi:MFS family permease
MFSDLFWASLLDKVGRRPLILCQPPATTCIMAIIVGLYATYTGTDELAGLRGLCAMVFIFVFVFSMDEPAEFVFIAEIYPTHVRTKGIALGCASVMLTGVWLTLSAPTGIAKVGWRYFLVFVVLGVFYSFAQYPFIKETKGVPLEEIDAIFGDGENVAVYSKDIVLDSAGVHVVGATKPEVDV